MTAPLYPIDRTKIAKLMQRRGLPLTHLSTVCGISTGTLRRLQGYNPPQMPRDRLDRATKHCIKRLAYGLRVPVDAFADMPLDMPEEKGPESPSVMGRPRHKVPVDIRDRKGAKRHRHARSALASELSAREAG
jgi:hypothetical protein